MFRPQITVLDATIRDGGLMNNWDFDLETVRKIYSGLVASGIDYMEVGYKANRTLVGEGSGVWRYCEEEELKRLVDGIHNPALKLSAMVDIGRVEEDDILPKSESLLDMIRVATYVKDVDKAIHLENLCRQKGYETCINIMAVSHALESDLDEALHQINEETKVKAVYVVDSFGSLFSEQIHYLVQKFINHITNGAEVGIHTHNNQQLAYANTIEAIRKNANFVDATLYGIGRGAGNCPLELIMSFLKNPKFNLRPVIELIDSIFIPLSSQISWGYHIPYMLAGVHDEHPRLSLAHMDKHGDTNLLEFYDQIHSEHI